MKHLLASSVLALVAASSTATAQSAYPDGFTPYGYIDLSYIDSSSGGSGDTVLTSDAGFSWGFGGAFGVDFSLFAFAVGSDSFTAPYLALSYDFGDMRASIGKPRAAYDAFGAFRLERQVPIYGFFLSPYTNSLVTTVDFTDEAESYGVRLDGTTGALTYAVSIHGYQDEPGIYTISSGMRYDMGSELIVTGGIEYSDIEDESASSVKFGVSKSFGQFQTAVNAVWSETPFAMSASVTAIELSGGYDFNDRLSAGLSVSRYDDGLSDTLIGADVRYDIWNGASAYAGVVGTTGGSSDGVYSIGLSYDF